MTSDAAAPDAADAGPARPTLPTVANLGGPIIKAARIVPVFAAGDALQPQVTDFLTKYLASVEWSDITTEYGVQGATSATPVVVPALPTGDDVPVASWLLSQLDGTHPDWGPTDDVTLASTVFVLFVTPSSVTHGGSIVVCEGPIVGWHSSTADSLSTDAGAPDAQPASEGGAVEGGGGGKLPGVPVVYAIAGECPPTPQYPDPLLNVVTSVTSHEIFEAVTDPRPDTIPAYYTVAPPVLAYWADVGGAELGDMCEAIGSDWFTPPALGYEIQRLWSNAAARAGHDPCVPAIPGAGPYFKSVPDAPDTFTDPATGQKALGIHLTGAPRTVDVHLSSEGPTADWTVQVVEFSSTGASDLKYTFDRLNGHDGDVLHLTLSVEPYVGKAKFTVPFMVVSTAAGSNAVQTMWMDDVFVDR